MKIEGKSYLIWTRSLDDWQEDSLLLQNHPVLHLPCIQTRKIESPELHEYVLFYPHKVAVFTSWRAVLYALEDEQISNYLKNTKIYCFGNKTKSFLEKNGFQAECFKDIRSASEIPTLIAKRVHPKSLIFLPGPKKRAFDLEASLIDLGFPTQSIDLYETIASLKISEDETNHLIANLNGIVFFASPSACIGFVESLCPQNNRLSSALSVLAIGPTTAKLCKKYFQNVRMASENSLEYAIQSIPPPRQ